MLRKRKNKNYISVTFLSDELEKIPKKKQKNLKKYHYGFFSSQNRTEKTEKERKKILFFLSIPTQPVTENSKKITKKLKKLKNTLMTSLQAKIGW